MFHYFATEELKDFEIYDNVKVPKNFPADLSNKTTIKALKEQDLLADYHLDMGRTLGIKRARVRMRYEFSHTYTRVAAKMADGSYAPPNNTGASFGVSYDEHYTHYQLDRTFNIVNILHPFDPTAGRVNTTNTADFTLSKDQFTLINLAFKSPIVRVSSADLSVVHAQLVEGLIISRPVLFLTRPGAGLGTRADGIFSFLPSLPKSTIPGSHSSGPTGPTGPVDRKDWLLRDITPVQNLEQWQILVCVFDAPPPFYTASDNTGVPIYPYPAGNTVTDMIRFGKIRSSALDVPSLSMRFDLGSDVDPATLIGREVRSGGGVLLAPVPYRLLVDPNTPIRYVAQQGYSSDDHWQYTDTPDTPGGDPYFGFTRHYSRVSGPSMSFQWVEIPAISRVLQATVKYYLT